MYMEPGEYTVSLRVSDDDGAYAEYTWSIKVLTPEEAKHDILDYIKGRPDDAFDKHPDQRKKVFESKFKALDKKLENEAYNGFIHDIINDVRAKCDGSIDGKANNDWVIETYAQGHICSKINDLVEYIKIVYL